MSRPEYVSLDTSAPYAALDYPGTPAPESGVLEGDRFWLGRDPGPLEGRRLVLAVGANAAPAVLARKLARAGASGPVAMVLGEVTGLAVGHSAHVSLGGYLPAGPYASRATSTVVALWLTADQAAAVDATEPNYVRTRLLLTNHPLRLDRGDPPEAYDVYVSRWGVLAVDGTPLPLGTQRELHARLARVPVLAELAPWADPTGVVAALADESVRDRVRQGFADAGWVADAGLPRGTEESTSS